MNDMNAFERQLAGVMVERAGPVRPVDDAAIFSSITATHSPKWRVQSLFSASKLVVAGAIVALFGGLLLAGVSTEPSDDTVPAVGASASPRAQVELTPEATSEPEPAPTDSDTEQADTTEAAASPGSFSSAGSLAEARWFHTATLLRDGRVLVVGGYGTGGSLSSAEIWDPETASFSSTGSLAEPRSDHTATLLPDGRVLVVGGCCDREGPDTGGDMRISAEVWDPETGTFAAAGSLAEAHGEHTATLLPDGRVLIVGGYRAVQDYAQTAEVWDPETESFDPADLLAAARYHHSATLLGDGRVLIVGGEGEHGGVALVADPPAEVWDPVTGSSSPAGSLVEGRLDHKATLLHDGRVLVVGGERFYAPTSVAEIWDPETASFTPAGSPLVEARRGHTATLLPDGRVLVVGGASGYQINDTDNRAVHATAEIWDPDTASFSPAGSLAEARADHTATPLADGRVLVIGGGIDGGSAISSAEVWESGDGSSVASDAARQASALTTTQPIELPAEIPDGIEWGTLDTPLGPARWAHLHGSETTLPTAVYPLPMPSDGYIALDQEAEQLWMSPDLMTWSSQSAPLEARNSRLTVAGDAAWLTGSDPASLWHSSDALQWSEVHLEALMPPEPAGPWLLELGAPVTFGDTTVVPFSHSPDPLLVHLAMGGTREDRVRALCCRGVEGGLYRLSDDKFENFTTVRFEVADGGLRVIDADGMEMAFLDGVELGFIELLALSDGWVRVPGLAIVEQGGLVPVELPDDIRGQPDTAFVVDVAGFAAYGLGPDGLVHVYRSADGRDWREAEIIGDDPGEPTEIVGVGRYGTQYGGLGSVFIESEPHITEWTSSDGGTWESRHRPDQFGGEPFASGWIEAQGANESGPWPGWEVEVNTLWYVPAAGEPVAIDVSALGLADPDGVGPAIPISSNTVLLGQGGHGPGPRDLLIITFDELPA